MHTTTLRVRRVEFKTKNPAERIVYLMEHDHPGFYKSPEEILIRWHDWRNRKFYLVSDTTEDVEIPGDL